MKAYLDNAATTPLDPEVFEVMKPYLLEHFGNPSSIHTHGRQARSGIETARKKVASLLNVAPAEIFFTSCATEADNMAITCSVRDLGVKHIITSKIEHHAVLHTVQALEKQGINVSYVDLDGSGAVNYEHLKALIEDNANSLVSLMHANNEIGNLLDLDKVGDICNEHNALFHSDTVQSIAHYKLDFEALDLDFAAGSAHKFHGPKGIGFIYINHQTKIHPFIHGGAQERNMRGGTENVAGIVGLAKAMEIAYEEMDHQEKHIKSLKERMIFKLKQAIPQISFNGHSDLDNSLYTVLNVNIPPFSESEMLLFNLDINGIAVSAGSACSSGSDIGSHVLAELERNELSIGIRFSFSKYNTEEEIDYTVTSLSGFLS